MNFTWRHLRMIRRITSSMDDLMTKLNQIRPLVEGLKRCSHDQERIALLDQECCVRKWLQAPSPLRTLLTALSLECELVIKSLVAIEQHDHLFSFPNQCFPFVEKVRELLNDLLPVELFYREMGGIVGYHFTICSLIVEKKSLRSFSERGWNVYQPPKVDISEKNKEIRSYLIEGIRALPRLAEIYPVGGAADRLRLCDPLTGVHLPAALLPFCGRTLLEGLVRDVIAKEYLYYQLFGEQITVPIAMMTSKEKDNHFHVVKICEEMGWFGRSREAFQFFCQPLVPTVDQEGKWCKSEEMKLVMKPGGHGAIWKLAQDRGVFRWLRDLGKEKILVRQINNPIAGIDDSLLVFCGIGCQGNKVFGFASCPRQVHSAEGVNVLLEKTGKEDKYCLTSIEYCDFSQFGIEDVPIEEKIPDGVCYSQYPSNTNILFADIVAVEEVIKECRIPGGLVNFKEVPNAKVPVARLESTMQNIADYFVDSCDHLFATKPLALRVFLTNHLRHKTISTTKKEFQPGGVLLETPEGCYYDLLRNHHELLTTHCFYDLPPLQSPEKYVEQGPAFLFHYHPALGPSYEVIAQKLKRGGLEEGSELHLEIAEIIASNLRVTGSLLVVAKAPVGKSCDGIVRYSKKVGRCQLFNVKVENEGINHERSSSYWKGEVLRKECCEIIIHGDGELEIKDVILNGAIRIEVKEGTKMTVSQDTDGKLEFREEAISLPSWVWEYSYSEGGIVLVIKSSREDLPRCL